MPVEDALDAIPASAELKQELSDALQQPFPPADPVRASPGGLDRLRVYCFSAVSSTMDVAALIAGGCGAESLERAALGSYEHSGRDPAVVLALEQSAGRGRQGRQWHSTPYGGIYATFLRYPRAEPAALLGCSLSVGVAVREFFGQYEVEAGVKWPNDVLTAAPFAGVYRKLAGILVELNSAGSRVKALSVGVGVNLNHSSFPDGLSGASIFQLTGQRVAYAPACAELLRRVHGALERFEEQGFAAFIERFRQYSLLGGALIRFESPERRRMLGRVLEVCADGGLQVETLEPSPRVLTLYSGEIELQQTAEHR